MKTGNRNQKLEVRNQKSEISSQKSVVSRKRVIIFCLLSSVFCLLSCSVPNLEDADCTAARGAVRDFYSYHFGSEMRFTPENLREREKFLTGELLNNLRAIPLSDQDPFTLTSDLPKAFRVGGCRVIEPNHKVSFGVLLFWRTENRSEQREIHVEAVKQNDNWLVNKISQ